MHKKLGIAAVGLALAAAGLFAFSGQGQLGQTAIPAANAETTAAATTTETPLTEVKNFTLGAADAKVKIVEYASFTCPHCASFHAGNWDRLKAEYIDTGKVQFEFREVYFDRYGLWAAMVARCGGEMRYFGVADMLFEKQKDWVASDDPTVVVGNLKDIGRAAGMEDTALEACLQDTNTAQSLYSHFETQMAADGVEGTPTLFINGAKHGNMPFDELQGLIEAELAK